MLGPPNAFEHLSFKPNFFNFFKDLEVIRNWPVDLNAPDLWEFLFFHLIWFCDPDPYMHRNVFGREQE